MRGGQRSDGEAENQVNAAGWVGAVANAAATWESFPARVRDPAVRAEFTPAIRSASLAQLERLEVAVRAVAEEVKSI